VLEALLHLGPLCQKDIAAKILKSGGNITLVVDNLEKRGLAERVTDPDDRRRTNVVLTREGRERIESVFPRHVEQIVDEFSVLNQKEKKQLADLCKKVGLQVGRKKHE
ncbi:MAG: MarR family transcriptional regulator, partial [Verrucomicrobiota bacterium]